MAQVPATPKMRRFSLLTAARLFGPDLLLKNSDLQASERAALTLRSLKPARAPEKFDKCQKTVKNTVVLQYPYEHNSNS